MSWQSASTVLRSLETRVISNNVQDPLIYEHEKRNPLHTDVVGCNPGLLFLMFIDHPMRSYLSLVSRACFFNVHWPSLSVASMKGDRKCHLGHQRCRAGFACVTSLSLIVRSFLFSQSVLVGLSLFFVIGINSGLSSTLILCWVACATWSPSSRRTRSRWSIASDSSQLA